MPQITQKHLQITENLNNKTVDITVTARLQLSSAEFCLLRMMRAHCNDLQLVVSRCEIWGEDAIFNGADDYLFNMPNQAQIVENNGGLDFTWRATVAASLLNEDNVLSGDKDEIYAKPIIGYHGFVTNTLSLTTKSNVVTGKFF